jgi:type II secretory pathway component PulK
MSRLTLHNRQSQQRGIALAIVVWFIAGMSILVAGIVAQASVDTRMAQVHVARAKASAAGDGAIALMLAERQGVQRDRPTENGGYSALFRVGALDVEVELVPVSQLINVNSADAQLLALLFTEFAALSASEAQDLANNVVQWRQQMRSQYRKMEAPEDMMAAGVPRTVLDAIRDYIVAGAIASSSTQWASMHPALQNIARSYRPEQAGRRPDDLGAGASGYRADAIVRYGDSSWLRRRWISTTSSPHSRLPWRALRTETPRVVIAR